MPQARGGPARHRDADGGPLAAALGGGGRGYFPDAPLALPPADTQPLADPPAEAEPAQQVLCVTCGRTHPVRHPHIVRQQAEAARWATRSAPAAASQPHRRRLLSQPKGPRRAPEADDEPAEDAGPPGDGSEHGGGAAPAQPQQFFGMLTAWDRHELQEETQYQLEWEQFQREQAEERQREWERQKQAEMEREWRRDMNRWAANLSRLVTQELQERQQLCVRERAHRKDVEEASHAALGQIVLALQQLLHLREQALAEETQQRLRSQESAVARTLLFDRLALEELDARTALKQEQAVVWRQVERRLTQLSAFAGYVAQLLDVEARQRSVLVMEERQNLQQLLRIATAESEEEEHRLSCITAEAVEREEIEHQHTVQRRLAAVARCDVVAKLTAEYHHERLQLVTAEAQERRLLQRLCECVNAERQERVLIREQQYKAQRLLLHGAALW